MGLFGLQFVMSDGSQWKVVSGNQATVAARRFRHARSASPAPRITGCSPRSDSSYILTLERQRHRLSLRRRRRHLRRARGSCSPGTIQGYYGVLGAGPAGSYFLMDGLILNSALTVVGGSAQPGADYAITGGPVSRRRPGGGITYRHQHRAAQRGLGRGAQRHHVPAPDHAGAPEHHHGHARRFAHHARNGQPDHRRRHAGRRGARRIRSPAFSARRVPTCNPRQMVVDSAGTTAYAITLSGLSVISLAPTGSDTRPTIAAGARGVMNSADGTAKSAGLVHHHQREQSRRPAVAESLPPPTVLGGSCVTFGDVAVPLAGDLERQIQAQVPDTLRPGTQVVAVRSLATAQQSDPVTITTR